MYYLENQPWEEEELREAGGSGQFQQGVGGEEEDEEPEQERASSPQYRKVGHG